MKKVSRSIKALLIAALLPIIAIVSACGTAPTEPAQSTGGEEEVKTYTIGLCNFVDDASLNQICDNIKSELEAIGTDKNVKFEVRYDNANADGSTLSQIAANFNGKVDLIIAVATPVAMTMQGITEDSKTPVVFAAVSDPVSAGLVESMEKPGSNVTGTSDMLNTKAILDLALAIDPELKKVGLLYDQGQDSSKTPITEAKAILAEKNIEVIERTGTTVDEVALAAQALVDDGVEIVFTPTDNTIMQAELSIYETFEKAGIKHYCGADSFALNGAFLGYGVNYANLGKETAQMAAEVLLEGKDPATLAVRTFDNGIASVNEEVIAAMELDLQKIVDTLKPLCSDVVTLKTAESFE